MAVRERFDLEAFNRDSAEVLRLFDAYCAEERSNPDFSEDHATEVRHRLERMTRMVNRIYELQEESKALTAASRRGSLDRRARGGAFGRSSVLLRADRDRGSSPQTAFTALHSLLV